MTRSLLFDAILYLYVLSLLFYVSDLLGAGRKSNRVAEGLLAFVWLLQTVYLAANLYDHGYRNVSQTFTMAETYFLFSWLLVTVTLIINRFVRIELLVFFVNVFGFAVLALVFFSRPGVIPLRPEWEISDELLFIHITLSIGSYAAFLLSAVLSGLYLFLFRRLKEKNWTATMKRLPSLDQLDTYAYRAVIIGAPMLLLASSLGIVWLILLKETVYLLDPKVVNSLVVLAAYTYYIIRRLSNRVSSHKLAVWNLVAFGVVMVNFILSNSYSRFHQWIWM